MSFYWLSFCDVKRPKGSQFLGACCLRAESLEEALTRSHLMGINPGGEVASLGPIDEADKPADFPIDRLLQRHEIPGAMSQEEFESAREGVAGKGE
jgi:hypothetical protein